MTLTNIDARAKEDPTVEEYQTVKSAAAKLGLPYFKLQRAVLEGIIPTYTFLNKRKLVLLSDIEAVIRASRKGGAQ